MRTEIILSAVAAMAMAITSASPATAKIRCKGPFQVVQGNQIATPYCGDNYLAQVARGYGSSVSARAIRQSPSKKEEICNWIGHDTRVQDICAGFRNDDGGRNR
mgnify:FL=1